MKFHITNAYKVNDTVEKETTNYFYSTSDVAERNEIPLTNYYEGNWTYKSNGEIAGYDNKGFSIGGFNNYYHTVRAQSGWSDPTHSSFYIRSPLTGPQINNAYDDFWFYYYGNYKVYFIPIPAKHYVWNSTSLQDEFVDTVYYIPIARVTKDLSYSHTHSCFFEKRANDPYLKCVPVDYNIDQGDNHFIRWRQGGTYYGARDYNFTSYVDLGNFFNDLRGMLVPQNSSGYIYAPTAGISKSFGMTTIKSTRLLLGGTNVETNKLVYYLTGPIYYSNTINNVNKNHYMDFRFLPYTAEIRPCYRYYQNNLSGITLENLLSFNDSTGYARINFNGINYDVHNSNMLYIGLDTFVSWYRDKLNGTGQDYIINGDNYNYTPRNIIYERVYINCSDEHCQAILSTIKDLYDNSTFDIQLYDNGFYGTVGDSRYQAGKFTTRNINETTRITSERIFNG